MIANTKLVGILIVCAAMCSCSSMLNILRGGLHRQLDENLTIASLQQDPARYLNQEIVFSVRYYKKGDLPCPLGEDYVNFSIADRVSYIMLDKVWIKKDKAGVMDKLKENETVIMKARVFKVDSQKDPNLEALEIVPE